MEFATWLRKKAAYLSACTILFLALLEVIVVLGAFHRSGFSYYSHSFIICFLTFNVIGNLIFCKINDSSLDQRPVWMESSRRNEPTNWTFCEKCKIMQPPRCLHCNLCEACILKRDHHCLLIGRCIGLKNYRYFMVFIVYAAIETIYLLYINVVYIFWCESDIFSGIWTKLACLNPMLLIAKYFWDGNIDWSFLLIPIFTSLLVAGVSANFILAINGRKFFCGGRYYENRGLSNLKSMLGEHYILVWISPFVSSTLPNDGGNWQTFVVEQKNS